MPYYFKDNTKYVLFRGNEPIGVIGFQDKNKITLRQIEELPADVRVGIYGMLDDSDFVAAMKKFHNILLECNDNSTLMDDNELALKLTELKEKIKDDMYHRGIFNKIIKRIHKYDK